MKYVKIDENGVPVETPISFMELRARFSNVGFSNNPSDNYLRQLGYARVPIGNKPENIPPGTFPELDVPELVDGKIVRTYKFTPATTDQLNYNANLNRQKRQGLLTDSDWTQVADAPLTEEKKQEWASYRQALRDITSDPQWPIVHTWPTKPT